MLAPRALNTTKNPVNFCSTYLSPVPYRFAMATEQITIQVDNDTARAYKAASLEDRYKSEERFVTSESPESILDECFWSRPCESTSDS